MAQMRLPERRVALAFITVSIALVLSGCVKARISINVAPDGSGTYGIALGMDSQARAFASSEGQDPIALVSDQLSDSAYDTADIAVRRWTEGDYEWVESAIPFDDPEDLNRILAGEDAATGLSLTRQPGLLKTRFVLQGDIAPFPSSPSLDAQPLLFDPDAMFEFQLAATLPGRITETNGSFVDEDRTTVVWALRGDDPVEVLAISESWNWLNIAGLFAAACLLAVASITAAGFMLYRLRVSTHSPGPVSLPTDPETFPYPYEDESSALVRSATELYQAMGHRVDAVEWRTSNTADILITCGTGEKWIARCVSSGSLNEHHVTEFLQNVRSGGYRQAALITSAQITHAARLALRGLPIHLVDPPTLDRYTSRAKNGTRIQA